MSYAAIDAFALLAGAGHAHWCAGECGEAAPGGIGALVALLGGWLGAALLGLTFAWPTAVWCAVLGVALLPRLIAWWGARRRAYRRPRPI